MPFRNQAKHLFIDGLHDVDQNWMNELRSDCGEAGCPQIVPRLVWEAEGFYQDDISVLEEVLRSTLQKYSFDGFVVEVGFSEDLLFLYSLIRTAVGDASTVVLVATPRASEALAFSEPQSVASRRISFRSCTTSWIS